MTKEQLEYLAAVAGWLESWPDKAEEFYIDGIVKVHWHGDVFGYFDNLDGWWEYHEGPPVS